MKRPKGDFWQKMYTDEEYTAELARSQKGLEVHQTLVKKWPKLSANPALVWRVIHEYLPDGEFYRRYAIWDAKCHARKNVSIEKQLLVVDREVCRLLGVPSHVICDATSVPSPSVSTLPLGRVSEAPIWGVEFSHLIRVPL
jgi:hypothetical protein